jgi:hypothetical protein
VAFGAMAAAGVVAATGRPGTIGSGAFSSLAQACALVALTAALIPRIARSGHADRAPRPAGQQGDVR